MTGAALNRLWRPGLYIGRRFFIFSLVFFYGGLGAACNGCSHNDGYTPANTLPDRSLVRIDGSDVKYSDLPDKYRRAYDDLKYQTLRDLNRLSQNFLIDELFRRESIRRGLDEPALVSELSGEEIDPGDGDLYDHFVANKTKYPNGLVADEEKIRAAVIAELVKKLRPVAAAQLLKLHQYKILVNIPRVQIELEARHAIGPEDAPIQVFEFIDFADPESAKMQKMHREIRTAYSGRIRWVPVELPDPGFPPGWVLHRISRCAGDQAAYWKVAESFLENQNEILSALTQNDALAAYVEVEKRAMPYATAFSLNEEKLAQCSQAVDTVDKKMEAGLNFAGKYNIRRAPFYIINGRFYQGPMARWRWETIIAGETGR